MPTGVDIAKSLQEFGRKLLMNFMVRNIHLHCKNSNANMFMLFST